MASKPKPADEPEVTATAAAEPVAAAEVAAEPLSALEEFCARLSGEPKAQPHAVGAFFAEESEAGRHRDTDAAYRVRFAAMMRRPVA